MRALLGAVAGSGAVLAGVCLADQQWIAAALAAGAAVTAVLQLPPTERQEHLARVKRLRRN